MTQEAVTPKSRWRRLYSRYRYHTVGVRVALMEIRVFGLRGWRQRRKRGL